MDVAPRQGDLIWAGRRSGNIPGLDEWTVPYGDIEGHLSRAARVAIADPLSFPWEKYTSEHYGIPLVVLVESSEERRLLSAPEGPGILGRLISPVDMVVGSQDAFASAVAAEVDPGLRIAKERFNQLSELLAAEFRSVARSFGSELRVAADPALSASLSPRWRESVGMAITFVPHDTRRDDERHGMPAVSASVVAWTDGTSFPQPERVDQLRSAFNALQPGGSLIIVSDVVSVPGEVPCPSISEVFDDINIASGMSATVEEVKSVRWSGDSMSRGVLLRYHSLGLAHDVRGVL